MLCLLHGACAFCILAPLKQRWGLCLIVCLSLRAVSPLEWEHLSCHPCISVTRRLNE